MQKHRLAALLVVAISVAAFSTGCSDLLSCVVTQVFDAELAGPFVDAPDLSDIGSDADTITASTSTIYFLWTHPDAEEGDGYECKIIAVALPGVPEGTEMGSASGTSSAGNFGGQIMFTAPGTGWIPGTYRADIYLQGEQFDSLDFEVVP